MICLPPDLDAAPYRLQRLCPSDQSAMITQLSDARVATWLAAVPTPFGPRDADELLAFASDPAQNIWSIRLDGQMIGCLCLGQRLWFWVAPAHWGQGVMSTVLAQVLPLYFQRSAAPLEATCREDNAASQALLCKMGFSRAPTTRRQFFAGLGRAAPCVDYALTTEQWFFLNPPQGQIGPLTLRALGRADDEDLRQFLARQPAADLPALHTPEARLGWIDAQRYRGGPQLTALLRNDERRICALVMFGPDTTPQIVADPDMMPPDQRDPVAAQLRAWWSAVGPQP